MNDRPPKLTDDTKAKRSKKLRPWLCKLIGHAKLVNVEFIDSHDNWDGMPECPRCGALDPDWSWWKKLLRRISW
jgi:hypothetical protein